MTVRSCGAFYDIPITNYVAFILEMFRLRRTFYGIHDYHKFTVSRYVFL